MNTEFTFEPLAYLHCGQKYRSFAPRQAVFAENEGIIRFAKGRNFEQALSDLSGFSRIWVIFCFHLNKTWKPLVHPPVVDNNKKISVFATRSPHRPNPIGMSCVELVKVDGLDVHIRSFDLLDKTPILDIKPYIPAVDSFSDANIGWLEKAELNSYKLNFSESAQKQMLWLHECGDLDLKRFCEIQLSHDPLNAERKRLSRKNDREYIIFCRTWQIHFEINESSREIKIEFIKSNYSTEELTSGASDPYMDKDIHRRFHEKSFQEPLPPW